MLMEKTGPESLEGDLEMFTDTIGQQMMLMEQEENKRQLTNLQLELESEAMEKGQRGVTVSAVLDETSQ